MANKKNEEYPPEIQSVIDRFISGEIPSLEKERAYGKVPEPGPERQGWANSHEEAIEMLENKEHLIPKFLRRVK